MLFRRASVRYGRTPEPETPYQKAAQVWDERVGSARIQARNWRLIAFGNLFLAAGLAGGLIWQAARGTVTPWVVEVDKLGEAQAVSAAVADYRPTDPQIAWHLARFVENVRAIPADPVIVRQNWLAAYDFITDKGAVALNDYARANDPFAKSPGWSGVTRTRASPPPSGGPRSSPSCSTPRTKPNACAGILSACSSMPSTGRRSLADAFPVPRSHYSYVHDVGRLRHLQAAADQLR
jgi:VirB8 protein